MYGSPIGAAQGGAGANDDIHALEHPLVQPKTFANHPAPPVAGDRAARRAEGDRQAESRLRQSVLADMSGKQLVAQPPALLVDRIELSRGAQPLLRAETSALGKRFQKGPRGRAAM